MRLIGLVTQRNYSIFRAANALRIKYSTAKLILKKYTQEGTVFEPKVCRIQRERRQATTSQAVSPHLTT